jgi:Fe2+ or Zn2+ uptake regulation protein
MTKEHTSMEYLKEYLINEGIHPSYQRLRIFEYLDRGEFHPTVDMIYNELAKEIPTLSKTTIYNTLNLFKKNGIVTGLTIEANEVRYDTNMQLHAHFKCDDCGMVYDIQVEIPYLTSLTVDGHRICERHLYLKGTCKNCLKETC